MLAALIALGLAAVPAPAAPPPEKAQPQAEPLIVRNADGSWTITRAIEEPAPQLSLATDALLIDEPDFAAAPREALRDEEIDQQAEDAFEEAVEAARRDEVPD
jgi:hypothetical protein